MLRSLILCLLLVLLPLAGWCGEIDPVTGDIVAKPAEAATTWWKELVAVIMATVVTPFLVQFMRAKSAAAAAEAERARVVTNGELIDQKGVLLTRVKEYLWGSAAAIAEKRFPYLANAILAGQMKTVPEIKRELFAWGAQLRTEAITYFGHQGIDLVATIGEEALDALIERAANAVSPFPGKETAVALLKDGVAPLLLDKGIDWMRERTMGRTLEPLALAVGTVEAKG